MEKGKRGPDLNRQRADYGSAALPLSYPAMWSCRRFAGGAVNVRPQLVARQAGDLFNLQNPVDRYPAPLANRRRTDLQFTCQRRRPASGLDHLFNRNGLFHAP